MLSPLLKKRDADHEEFSNFRPISNLKSISETIERAVASQLKEYVMLNFLDDLCQSA